MKFKELENLNLDQLSKQLAELRGEMEELRVKQKLDQVKNRHEFGNKRKDVARILTAINAK